MGAVELVDSEVIEVCNISNEAAFIQLVDGFRAKRVDVHCPPADEMFDAPLYLWRTVAVVGTVPGCLALVAHQLCATFRTVVDEFYTWSALSAGEE